MKGSLLSTTEIAAPYAQALMSLAQGQNLVDQFSQNVADLLELLNSSDDLKQLLSTPLIDGDKKKAVLQQVVGDQVHPYMRNFLMLLVDRQRIGFLEEICKQYQALVRNLNQTVLAEVLSAVELTDEQKQSVRDKVVAMTGAHQVDLETKIDSDLLGGVIIKVGSQVIDASLRGQIRRISLQLSNAL
jgi:F-type H+-transporting ATPase subunit delta